MRILISGSSGLIGSALCAYLLEKGHHIVPLLREHGGQGVFWNPIKEELRKEEFEGFDAVIHLSGENPAGFWTRAKKKAIFQSRCRDTWLLAQVLSRLEKPPKVVICASAVGYYGDRGDEVLTEKSGPGKGFLADLCVQWEKATSVLEEKGIRVVHTRFGMVLGSYGGMLKEIIPIFKLGLGSKLGSGKQYISWVALVDAVRAIEFCLERGDLSGPVNVTSPHPVQQAEFAEKLAHSLHRKLLFTMPAFLLHLLFGQMAQELMLSSERAVPEKLLASGFHFDKPDLQQTLATLE